MVESLEKPKFDDQFEEATTLRIYNIELKAIECLVSGKGPTTYPSPKK